ncbi:MAG: UDP-N-acetylmuramoyl-tripeptide--D-alanyl-D-alanine ligase [Peptococcaceae bacterium]|nr:UDP-N-acetylmuramoyl-tripeptide--D-alanyl-D-alanine ligase [Peptococcaceae bacterium]
MYNQSLAMLSRLVDGELLGPDIDICGAAADHRQVTPGNLFFALPGARQDGHDYVAQAVANGAVGAVVSRQGEYPCSVVLVPDTKKALIKIATARLVGSSAKVVAITGSVGKTSVKEMTAAALKGVMKVYRSPGNFNTEVGLPLSVLNHGDEDVLVLEMGMRGLGQIAALALVAPPDIAIITNVGEAHIELLGTRENISQAKGEILLGMKAGGTAILCRDDDFYDFHRHLTRGPVLSVGYHPDADLRLSQSVLDEDGCCHYMLQSGAESFPVYVPWPGRHNALNSSLAIAAAVVLGVDIAQAIAGIQRCAVKSQRLEVVNLPQGYTLIDDTYNASPTSVVAALHTLDHIAKGRRRVSVLGSMFELGERSQAAHQEVGEVAGERCDLVVTLGKEAQGIAKATRAKGIKTVECDEPEQVLAVLRTELRSGDVILVKGSRGMQMERITAVLRKGDD